MLPFPYSVKRFTMPRYLDILIRHVGLLYALNIVIVLCIGFYWAVSKIWMPCHLLLPESVPNRNKIGFFFQGWKDYINNRHHISYIVFTGIHQKFKYAIVSVFCKPSRIVPEFRYSMCYVVFMYYILKYCIILHVRIYWNRWLFLF